VRGTLAVLLALALGACGSKQDDARAPGDAGADAAESDAAADGPDFSALDPANCPPAAVEDLHGFEPDAALATSGSLAQDKAFYILTLLDQEPSVTSDATLSSLASARAQALSQALATCADDATCLGGAARWSEPEIAAASDALLALGTDAPARLRRSGAAALHAAGDDAELLRGAWTDAARALNKGWDDHVAPLAAPDRHAMIQAALSGAAERPYYRPLLDLVLAALSAASRDEAWRYEPLVEGENAAAVARIPMIDFASFPFSVIVVPGKGPGNLDHALDPGGRIRADQAAARFQAGLAPLIALSGGHVHPDRTPYSEAIEMKKYLKSVHAIPEHALLVDPHARHTTTNLRNVGRQLYRYGIPTDRPALITTDLFQTLYIAAASDTDIFGKRSLEELGYKPWRGITQLDSLDDCWLPAVQVLHQDARDLLDP
jgi:hypothetical protein